MGVSCDGIPINHNTEVYISYKPCCSPASSNATTTIMELMLVLYYNVTYRFIQVASVVAVISSRVQWFRPGSNIGFTHPLSLVCFCMEAFYFFLTFTALAILLIKGHLPAVPNLFTLRDQFCGRQFFHGPRVGGVVSG